MQWLERNSWKVVFFAILFSLAVSAGIAIHSGPILRYEDEKDYTQLATNLVNLHSYSMDGVNPTASRPPGYVWFLAIAKLFHSSNTAIRLFNVASLAFCQIFAFLLARQIASKAVAVITILLSLTYPVLFYSATVLFPQTFGAALLLCSLWIIFGKTFTLSKALAAGTVWAILIITIPTFLIVGGALTFWLTITRPQFRRGLVVFVAPIVLLLGSWSLRNYTALHSYVFVATNGGINLLLGNSEHVTAMSGSSADVKKYTAVGHQLPEVQQDKYYAKSAKTWIKDHPAQAARLYSTKLVHYFWFVDKTAVDDTSTSLTAQSLREWIMAVSYGPLLLIFVLRIAFFRKYPLSSAEVCLIGVYIVSALEAAMFFPRIRFRLPMDWLMLIIDAGFICALAHTWSSARRARSVVAREPNASVGNEKMISA